MKEEEEEELPFPAERRRQRRRRGEVKEVLRGSAEKQGEGGKCTRQLYLATQITGGAAQ